MFSTGPFQQDTEYRQVPTAIELTTAPSRSSTDYQKQSWRRQHFTGWRFGILNGALLASLVFAINLSATIYGVVNSSHSYEGQKVIVEGDCDRVSKLNTGLHLGINVLSTLLLGASNYAMQCLSAPTRSEIDAAHSKRRWLDIGVLSFRNIRSISQKRALLWAILGLSSMPLHLFYNSAVYTSIYAFDFAIFEATPDMLRSDSSDQYLSLDGNDTDINYYPAAKTMFTSAIAGNLTNLTVEDCVSAYSSTYQTARGSLILVVANITWTGQSEAYAADQICGRDPVGWMCGTENCYVDDGPACSESQIDMSDWRPFGDEVQYCLSQVIEQKCRVQITPTLAYIVCLFNFLKAAILVYTFFRVKEDPLMTMGDAVATFLKRRDDTTQGHCLMGKDQIQTWSHSSNQGHPEPLPRPVDRRRRRWGSVISKKRWGLFIVLYSLILGICGFLLRLGLVGAYEYYSFKETMNLGIGAVNPATFISWDVPSDGSKASLMNALIANAPQPILSTIYYAYNGIFTCFMLGHEWNRFASHRKGLRVSTVPRGAQRTSYSLQLPKRMALPLMGLSAILHWLCSQSIFLVSIDYDNSLLSMTYPNGTRSEYDYDNATEEEQFVTCGYSPIAMISTISLGIVMVLAPLVLGYRRFRNCAMPVTGSCSASISACCHLPSKATQARDVSSSSLYRTVDEDSDQARLLSSPQARPPLSARRSSAYSMDSFSSSNPWSPQSYGENPYDTFPPYSPNRSTQSLCQEIEVGDEAAVQKVKWGMTHTEAVTVTSMTTQHQSYQSKQTIGHAAFSSREVTTITNDTLYSFL